MAYIDRTALFSQCKKRQNDASQTCKNIINHHIFQFFSSPSTAFQMDFLASVIEAVTLPAGTMSVFKMKDGQNGPR